MLSIYKRRNTCQLPQLRVVPPPISFLAITKLYPHASSFHVHNITYPSSLYVQNVALNPPPYLIPCLPHFLLALPLSLSPCSV